MVLCIESGSKFCLWIQSNVMIRLLCRWTWASSLTVRRLGPEAVFLLFYQINGEEKDHKTDKLYRNLLHSRYLKITCLKKLLAC